MRSKDLLSVVLVLAIIGLMIGGGYLFFKDLDGPTVTVTPQTDRISPATVLTVEMEDPSGIGSLTVSVRRNNETSEIWHRSFEKEETRVTAQVPFKDAKLADGAFELEIRAVDASIAGFGQGNSRTLLLPMRLDVQPPRLSVRTLPPNVRRGGTGMVVYSANEDIVSSGVLVNGRLIPGHRRKDGSYICFFPFPHTMSPQDFRTGVELTAADLAGNVTRGPITVNPIDRKFRSDRLTLTDTFLADVNAKLGAHAPADLDPLARYLHINTALRQANADTLRELAARSGPEILWEGPFLRMPRSKPVAGFADHRTCFYQGKLVGEYDHLGSDYASIRNDSIPAANHGRVLFTDDLGIYGNTVVLDHGAGVLSLYSHMSEFAVRPGDMVRRGDIIGKTGSSGLAFGDHLHFGILVGGTEVTAIEWIDPKWIKDNITGRLAQ